MEQSHELYAPLTVKCLSIAGIFESAKAMRLPKGSQGDSTLERLGKDDARLFAHLIVAGDDEAKAVRGVVAYLELTMQVGWMIQFEAYRHGVECLSTSSTMHTTLKRLSGKELAAQKQAELSKVQYTRIVMISY